jgi:hypothetical protein
MKTPCELCKDETQCYACPFRDGGFSDPAYEDENHIRADGTNSADLPAITLNDDEKAILRDTAPHATPNKIRCILALRRRTGLGLVEALEVIKNSEW